MRTTVFFNPVGTPCECGERRAYHTRPGQPWVSIDMDGRHHNPTECDPKEQA